MKLSALYTNQPRLFEPINFVPGLNVVLADIRLPENKQKDTHNLGKTILGRLIDFCLLLRRDPQFFLFKHEELFKDFVFFLEIELLDNTFVTIKRSVEQPTKISLNKYIYGNQDFTSLSESNWDHIDMPFEKAKDLLDGLLDLSSLKPWPYRRGLGYLLRSQDDYKDVFTLKKSSFAHIDWKPYLSHILGFNDKDIKEHYDKEGELSRKREQERVIINRIGKSIENRSKIQGMLSIKKEEAEKMQVLLDAFDLRDQDKEKTSQLVDEINNSIASLNSERYYLMQNMKKISASIKDNQILFNPEEAKQLFEEVGVYFQGQIKRDFEQLIEFNNAITQERKGYLIKESNEIKKRLKDINETLNDLGKQRSDILSFLNESDAFIKYKQFSNDLIILRADIASLEHQHRELVKLQELHKEMNILESEIRQLQARIDEDIDKQGSDDGSLFRSICRFFNEIVEEVFARKALLTVSTNKEGHIEFNVDILGKHDNTTSASEGHSYKKLLCIAFDMAIVYAHASDRFPRFVFHDGVFESLDNRKKENLLGIIRRYSDAYGIQHIITLNDSDIPPQISPDEPMFDDSEIILRLHDKDDNGRLFKMPAW
ncbi:MAG: DUF2326 domain-containing protein [Nitrospirae bacterium]|nr:DUF2326 domain-containing protein [Nitrospirota bacterium]MBF0592260.1 DUF2326 domain-containing protein [Nitrospirota bacterium]